MESQLHTERFMKILYYTKILVVAYFYSPSFYVAFLVVFHCQDIEMCAVKTIFAIGFCYHRMNYGCNIDTVRYCKICVTSFLFYVCFWIVYFRYARLYDRNKIKKNK